MSTSQIHTKQERPGSAGHADRRRRPTKVLDTSQVDLAREILGSQYVSYDMQMRDDGRNFHVVQYSLSCGSVQIDRIMHHSPIYQVPNGPLGAHFAVMASYEGGIRVTSAGDGIDLRGSGSVVLDNRRLFQMDWTWDAKAILVRIETTAVRRHLVDLLGDVVPAATFALSGPPTPRHTARWNAAARFIEQALQFQPEPEDMSLWRDELERFTVLHMLTTHPNSLLNDHAHATPAPASDAAARAAAEWLHARCDEPVRMGDLANELGVSLRGLQQAFRRLYGLTLHEYLRGARLQSAHLDLTSDGEVSIAEVAYRWGFSSPSRFARYYREYFGTLPSEANRRGYTVAPQQQLPDELRPDAAGQRGADTGR